MKEYIEARYTGDKQTALGMMLVIFAISLSFFAASLLYLRFVNSLLLFIQFLLLIAGLILTVFPKRAFMNETFFLKVLSKEEKENIRIEYKNEQAKSRIYLIIGILLCVLSIIPIIILYENYMFVGIGSTLLIIGIAVYFIKIGISKPKAYKYLLDADDFTYYYLTPSNFDNLVFKTDGITITSIYFTKNKPHSNQINLQVFKSLSTQLDAYFKGELTSFSISYKLNVSQTQKEVLDIVSKISYGKVISYYDIKELLAAKGINDVTIKDIKDILNSNPICIIIPCHRVVEQDDSLSSYVADTNNKKQLLGMELAYSNKAK